MIAKTGILAGYVFYTPDYKTTVSWEPGLVIRFMFFKLILKDF